VELGLEGLDALEEFGGGRLSEGFEALAEVVEVKVRDALEGGGQGLEEGPDRIQRLLGRGQRRLALPKRALHLAEGVETMAALIGGYLGSMAATTRSDSGRPAART
jgi:hypothetical protein